MILKKNNLKKEKRKSSILNKMLINTFYFTVIPLIITGLLIVYAYQSLTDAGVYAALAECPVVTPELLRN